MILENKKYSSENHSVKTVNVFRTCCGSNKLIEIKNPIGGFGEIFNLVSGKA